MMDDVNDLDDHSNNIIEGAARSKVSRSSMGSESMSLSRVSRNISSLVTIVSMLSIFLLKSISS